MLQQLLHHIIIVNCLKCFSLQKLSISLLIRIWIIYVSKRWCHIAYLSTFTKFFVICFTGCLVSLRGDLEWPLHSLDLTPCDILIWGHLKSCVSTLASNCRRFKGNNNSGTQCNFHKTWFKGIWGTFEKDFKTASTLVFK